MSELMWIKSHVELLLQREWDVCAAGADSDGDWPFRHGTAACWVSVLGEPIPLVHVFGHAVCGVKSSAKLLRELNDVQRRAVSARVALEDSCVVVSQAVNPIGLTQPVLAQALKQVGLIADDIGHMLAVMFDGHTPFEAQVTDSEDAS